MRPVSAEFLRAIAGSHEMIVRARVCEPGQTGTDPDGTLITVLDGDVELDASADVRSTVEMTTDGNGAWPDTATGLLAPYGAELFVERGIQYGTGTREWVSLGYHRIYSVEQDNAPNGPIRISGRDRMAGIVEAELLAPRQYPSSVTLGDVVEDLVTEVYPAATIEWDSGDTATLGRVLIAEDDRYAFLKDLIKARGKIWYWDHRGVLVIQDPPDVAVPVFTVGHGAGGVLVSLSRRLSREGVYNAVVATGEAADTDTPVRAAVIDANPNSRTYYHGPFGKVPRRYSSPFITTATQAKSAAAAILQQSLGVPYNVDMAAVPNPALEPYDPVRITYGGSVGAEVHVLDRITIPLTATQALTAATREQTDAEIGVLL